MLKINPGILALLTGSQSSSLSNNQTVGASAEGLSQDSGLPKDFLALLKEFLAIKDSALPEDQQMQANLLKQIKNWLKANPFLKNQFLGMLEGLVTLNNSASIQSGSAVQGSEDVSSEDVSSKEKEDLPAATDQLIALLSLMNIGLNTPARETQSATVPETTGQEQRVVLAAENALSQEEKLLGIFDKLATLKDQLSAQETAVGQQTVDKQDAAIQEQVNGLVKTASAEPDQSAQDKAVLSAKEQPADLVVPGKEDSSKVSSVQTAAIRTAEQPQSAIKPAQETGAGNQSASGNYLQQGQTELKQVFTEQPTDGKESELKIDLNKIMSSDIVKNTGTSFPANSDNKVTAENINAQSSVPPAQDDIFGQVINRIHTSLEGKVKEAIIELKPEHLGKAYLKITVEDNIVSVKMEVSSQAVKQVLESNMSSLKDDLRDRGFQASNISIDINTDGRGALSQRQPGQELYESAPVSAFSQSANQDGTQPQETVMAHSPLANEMATAGNINYLI